MKLTKRIILDTAESIIIVKGFESTTLLNIAEKLNVSHAALYKYYSSKEDIFESLALEWLEKMFKHLFDWKPTNTNKPLHDWLWLLATTKKNLYNNNVKMFNLYNEYIEKNPHLIKDHLHELSIKVESLDSSKNGYAVISAFTVFHNPHFCLTWNRGSYEEDFEKIWNLIF